MTRRLIWAGCGRHAEQMLLPQLMRHDVELVGVCDLDRSASQTKEERQGIDVLRQLSSGSKRVMPRAAASVFGPRSFS